jgi:hypothetical protein
MKKGSGWSFGIVLVIAILVLLFLVFLEGQGIQSLSYIMG